MRLTKLKLAGFKSFVDPTVFHVPDRVVAIVGPNGCGKSNLIDAVRWVMGESAARQLRGESMEDVIFSGSSARQPVGQASIELVFDNSVGKLGGAWARYNEIAIRRVVGRGGQSTYFLNGARCRRRDITDIFLGTGLGPRSYAIIEQGTISRVIDARPEELRVFLEEAAGISRYKERRRETENRIRHTRDNLERLTDLRDELERQLKHLQRQARSAEKYREYRARERELKGRLLALRWQALDRELGERRRTIETRRTELERLQAELRSHELGLEQVRDQQTGAAADLDRTRAAHYQLSGELTRVEQNLEHARELRQRQQAEHQRLRTEHRETLNQLAHDRARLDELTEALAEAQLRADAAEAAVEVRREQLQQAELALRDAQQQWDDFTRRAALPQRRAEVERTRIEQLERQTLAAEQRAQRWQAELASIAGAPGADALSQRQDALQTGSEQLIEAEARLALLNEQGARLTKQRQMLDGQRQELQARLQAARGQLASLHTLQEAALGRQDPTALDWLRSRGLDDAPRMAEQLDVEPGWEAAAETVLAAWLDALCVTTPELPIDSAGDLPAGDWCLLADRASSTTAAPDTLAARISGSANLQPLLAGVITVADRDAALTRRDTLAPGQSLVTADGLWLGRDWLRWVRRSDQDHGVLLRERLLRELEWQRTADAAALETLDEQQRRTEVEHDELETERVVLRDSIQREQHEQVRLQEQIRALEREQQARQQRRQQLMLELDELQQQLTADNETLGTAREQLEQALLESEQGATEQAALECRREQLRDTLDEVRSSAEQARTAQQREALRLQQLRGEQTALEQAVTRLTRHGEQLDARCRELDQGLVDDPEPNLREQLDRLLAERLNSDRRLAAARQAVAEQDAVLKRIEQQRRQGDQQLQQAREQLEALRLAAGELSVKRDTLFEQLTELETDPAAVLAEGGPETDPAALESELEQLDERIRRLGPINLAAIDEFAELGERKGYLDRQDADLCEALATLEDAMARMDRETRGRFKETFDQVNANLKTLFPRLFGGGQAFLELTGADALDAGVAIMARPPGKRIGHIQLLSGGEKALTAIALVFGIFQLNPAPFCMLDEVDAPLDDANVGRFGRLVRELSEQIQFVIVTHNKTSMEIAQHLAGVTMHEPGVSRLVAVDVDEAVRLAAV